MLNVQHRDDTAKAAEAKYPVSFRRSRGRFVLRLHYYGRKRFLFDNSVKMYHFIAKYSETKQYQLYLDSILKNFNIDNIKNTSLKGYMNAFLLILNLLIPAIF